MLTRIKIFPVSNYKQDDIYRNNNSSAFLRKIPGHHHPFPWLSMTLAVFHDFPGLENGLTKFHDFPWLSRKSAHPALRESWKSASVVNAHLVDDPTIRQPGFALPRQQWSLLNRFRTGQGHCGACKKKRKLSDSDQCSCVKTQSMTHIVESCPQTRLHGGLSKLHSADDDAVAWLTSYGS